MYFKKITNVVVCSAIGSAFAVSSSYKIHAKDLVVCHDCHMKRLPKAKELPLYDKKEDCFTAEYNEESNLPFISEVSIMRKQIFNYISYLDVFRKKAVDLYETGLVHSQSSIEYFKKEDNVVPRVIIIASGGLAGYLFARRRAIFKKIIYPVVGTTAVFTVFHPSTAKEYFSIGSGFIKHHIKILLENYGGYDIDKMLEESNAKIEYLKSTMKYESVMNKLNYWFYQSKNRESKVLNDEMHKEAESRKSAASE